MIKRRIRTGIHPAFQHLRAFDANRAPVLRVATGVYPADVKAVPRRDLQTHKVRTGKQLEGKK